MSMSQRDPNHIIRLSYDETANAIKIIPSSSTSFAIELDATDGDSVETRSMAIANTVLLNAVAAGTTVNSSAVDISKYKGIYISIIAAGLDAADGAIQLEASSDGTTFKAVSGQSVTLASGASNDHLLITDAPYAYFRIAYTKGTNTTGTVTVQYNLKG